MKYTCSRSSPGIGESLFLYTDDPIRIAWLRRGVGQAICEMVRSGTKQKFVMEYLDS